MSSTNRGTVRNASDYYVTPIPAIEAFLREWAKDEPGLKQVRRILDPCAGGTEKEGKIVVAMSYPEAIHSCHDLFAPDAHLSTMDIREDSCAVRRGVDYVSFLRTGLLTHFDLVISNPPFALAMEFIQKALDDTRDGGFVAMLLRLNFFGSEKRRAFMQTTPPHRCYVHSKRMGFTADGATDSIEYMHAVWQKGLDNRETFLRVI